MTEQLVVDSAEKFLLAIDALMGSNEVSVPVFKGWPNFHVQIEGDRYKGTMTPKLMEGFLGFHEQLLRAYAEARYDSPALIRMTAVEKAELELVFEISKCCTDGRSPLDRSINTLLSAIPMQKMNGRQVATVIIVTVLSFAGYHVFTEWNAANLEKARLDAQQRKDDTHAQIVAKLADVIADQQLPAPAARIRDRATEGYRSIVASAPDATSMNIQDSHYNADELEHIRAQEPKHRARAERREELYIEMIKRNPEYLALTLRLPNEEYTFPGRVELSTFDPEKIHNLFDAIKDAKPIKLFHYSVLENGRILRTAVIAVDDISI